MKNVFDNIFTATCGEGDVRLGIGRFTSFYTSITEFEGYYFIKDELARGRIEVCVGGRYGTISDTNWDNEDASVTCSQLGFSRYGLHFQQCICHFLTVIFFLLGAIAVSSGLFGDDVESSVLYEVDCSGNETEILNCPFSTSGVLSEHSASVICQSMQLCVVTCFCRLLHSSECRCRN